MFSIVFKHMSRNMFVFILYGFTVFITTNEVYVFICVIVSLFICIFFYFSLVARRMVGPKKTCVFELGVLLYPTELQALRPRQSQSKDPQHVHVTLYNILTMSLYPTVPKYVININILKVVVFVLHELYYYYAIKL